MPAFFSPGEYVLVTDWSSVAASGIAFTQYIRFANVTGTFHSSPIFLTKRRERSSLWLSHPVDSGIVPAVFRRRSTIRIKHGMKPRLTRSPFSGSPLIFCCLDFPPLDSGSIALTIARGEGTLSQRVGVV